MSSGQHHGGKRPQSKQTGDDAWLLIARILGHQPVATSVPSMDPPLASNADSKSERQSTNTCSAILRNVSWASLGIDSKLGWRSALMDEAQAHVDGRGHGRCLDHHRARLHQGGQRKSSPVVAAQGHVCLDRSVSADGIQHDYSTVEASKAQSWFVPSSFYVVGLL